MRLPLIVGLLALTLPARAQVQQPPIKLELSTDQAMLIVETLGQISCQKVSEQASCQLALQTIKDIQAQSRPQVK